jgi:hypothetical protein
MSSGNLVSYDPVRGARGEVSPRIMSELRNCASTHAAVRVYQKKMVDCNRIQIHNAAAIP